MSIGIIGAGALGSNLAKAFANAGIAATISNRRGPGSLAELVRDLGPSIRAGTTQEAASQSIVILAVPWLDLPAALSDLTAWNNRIVIDATNPLAGIVPGSADAEDSTNPFAQYGFKVIDCGGLPSSQIVADLVPGARLVKAFNHFEVERLPEPEAGGGRRVLFVSGADAAAMEEVRALIEQIGMVAIDLGEVQVGGRLAEAPFGPLALKQFVCL